MDDVRPLLELGFEAGFEAGHEADSGGEGGDDVDKKEGLADWGVRGGGHSFGVGASVNLGAV